MKKEEFYAKYANTPLEARLACLSNAYNDTLSGMTLSDVYKEISAIDDKLRSDEIRREKLLDSAQHHLNKVTLTKT